VIKTTIGNVLDVPTGIIVHGCNTSGVMGAGIALAVKRRFPTAYQEYHNAAVARGLNLGEIIVVEVEPNKFIVNAITQHLVPGLSPGRNANYDAIVRSFENVVAFADALRLDGIVLDVVFPMIGAGLAKGNWEIIEKIIDVTVPDRYVKTLYKLG